MSLEKTFQNVEKLPEEKKLEVITNKEAVLGELEAYFEKSKYKRWLSLDECRDYFVSCKDFLKSFQLTPEIITEFNTKTENIVEFEALGLYLSAMMQTSYNQGHNNFKFEEVNANFFGAFLKGQPENPIRIGVKKELKGYESLSHAEDCSIEAEALKGYFNLGKKAKNCSLTAESTEGERTLIYAENCSLKTKTLKGDNSLWLVYSCFVEIQNYNGTNFGYGMENCTIKSSNLETIGIIKNCTNKERNKFELKI